jgi:hypothetical protein
VRLAAHFHAHVGEARPGRRRGTQLAVGLLQRDVGARRAIHGDGHAVGVRSKIVAKQDELAARRGQRRHARNQRRRVPQRPRAGQPAPALRGHLERVPAADALRHGHGDDDAAAAASPSWCARLDRQRLARAVQRGHDARAGAAHVVQVQRQVPAGGGHVLRVHAGDVRRGALAARQHRRARVAVLLQRRLERARRAKQLAAAAAVVAARQHAKRGPTGDAGGRCRVGSPLAQLDHAARALRRPRGRQHLGVVRGLRLAGSRARRVRD